MSFEKGLSRGDLSSIVAAKFKPFLYRICLLTAAFLSIASVQAGVGITVQGAGAYQGTVGYNKGAASAYQCTNGVLRGLYHVDKAMGSYAGTSGMTSQVGLYCGTLTTDGAGNLTVTPSSPNGTPTVLGQGFSSPGTTRHGYCADGEVVTRLGGWDRQTTNVPWSSSLAMSCRGASKGTNDWVEFAVNNQAPERVGVNEDNAPHFLRGPFCDSVAGSDPKYTVVTGIYRQTGGEGYDGINVYCGSIVQARHSAYLQFQNYAWNKTLGGAGWRVSLRQSGTVLPGQENMTPWSSLAANNTATFTPGTEVYVSPGSAYGAVVSQRPSGADAASYVVSGNCTDGIALSNLQDNSCGITLTGRPDIAVDIVTPENPYELRPQSQTVNVRAVNMGPGAVNPAWGYGIQVTVPSGWDITGTLPSGCSLSGSSLTCQINQTLAGSTANGQEGGAINYPLTFTTNNSVVQGTYPVPVVLLRSTPDATTDTARKDYNTANDTDTDYISYLPEPNLTLVKITKGGVGSFLFDFPTATPVPPADRTITTTAPDTRVMGLSHVLVEGQSVTVTETPSSGTWEMESVSCLIADTNEPVNITQNLAGNSFTIPGDVVVNENDIVCTVTNQLQTVDTRKTSDYPNGAGVLNGDLITYTLTTVITGLDTRSDIVLTDTLSPGLDYQGVVSQSPAGSYSQSQSGQQLTFTLPAGTAPGTYSISYTAQVNTPNPGTVSVSNTVTSDTGSCVDCSTTHPVISVETTKTSDTPDGEGVQPGDIISYTLTTVIAGGPSGKDIVLTDTLGAGLTFNIVSDPGLYTADVSAAPVIKFTLPAGTPAGSHAVTYQVVVDNAATVSVSNTVTTDTGTCPDCTIENPIVSIKTSKKTNIPAGTAVGIGGDIIFTLSVFVDGGATTQPLVLTDSMDPALQFQGVLSGAPTPFSFVQVSSSPDVLQFTLPAGTPANAAPYEVSYVARVAQDNVEFVENRVVPSDGSCINCSTETDVAGIYISKTADYIDGTFVQRGDRIKYSITFDVQGQSLTAANTVATDTISPGLALIPSSFDVPEGGPIQVMQTGPSTWSFTLPAGSSPGLHVITYDVDVLETGNVSAVNNGLTVSNGNCTNCSVTNPIIEAETTKSNGLTPGQSVHTGQIISYELTTVVSTNAPGAGSGATTNDITLTDTIGAGLRYIPGSAAGAFIVDESAAPVLTFTLLAGTPVGTHTVIYQAEVLESANTTVNNDVEASYGSCDNCTIVNPVSQISTNKSATPSGTVVPGDEIEYALTVSVRGATTSEPVVLTDTLGEGLSYVLGSASGGNFTINDSGAPTLIFTLPAGSVAGNYVVTYRATVDADAVGEVSNNVISSLGSCDNCTVENPVSGVWVNKTASAAPGTAVRPGEVITYSLQVEVEGASNPAAVDLIDTLGTGLTYVAGSARTSQGGPFVINDSGPPVLRFTLPAGAQANSTHIVTYQATVDDAATTTVSNKVEATGGNCVDCQVDNPVSGISTIKKNDLAAGAGVMEGQEITYTLEVDVSNVPTSKDLLLVDTLGEGLEFVPGSVSGAGFTWNVDGAPRLEFTLLSGASVALHTVTYKAKVLQAATGSIANQVVPDAGSCDDCTIVNPVSSVVVKKGSDKGPNDTVRPEDVIRYNLTVTVSGAETLEAVVLTDTLGEGLAYVEGSASGAPFSADTSGAPVLVFTLPAGTPVGEYVVSYEAVVTDVVNDNSLEQVANSVISNLGLCDQCTVVVPVNPAEYDIEVVKLAELQYIRRGEQAPFTIRALNRSSYPARGVQVVDVIPVGFRYVNDSATVDGIKREPIVRGRTLTFDNIDIAPYGETLIRLRLLALSTAGPGKYTNVAFATDSDGNRVSNDGKADIEILAEPIFDCGDVIGTVYDDRSRNGYRDDGEPGLPGVRVVTVNGQLITTDRYGRWHIPCAALPDQRIGSNFIVKLDDRTLPTGYRLTSENPRVVRLTAGKMTEIDFGAAISRVVRLDLQGSAFEPGELALLPEWATQISQLIDTLKSEISVLRLSYHASEADRELAEQRIRHLRAQISEQWKREGAPYRLDIESSIEVAK